MKARLLVVGFLVTLALAGAMALQWQRAERRRVDTVRWTRFVLDSLATTVKMPPPPEGTAPDSVYWQWIATGAQLQSRRWQQAVRHWTTTRSVLLDEVDAMQLRSAGLRDPVRQLRDSLLVHTELIPEAALHGGTMRIWHGEHIVLLHSPYVFARYDDGHIGGSMLLEYAVDSTGAIQWKRLWSAQE